MSAKFKVIHRQGGTLSEHNSRQDATNAAEERVQSGRADQVYIYERILTIKARVPFEIEP